MDVRKVSGATLTWDRHDDPEYDTVAVAVRRSSGLQACSARRVHAGCGFCRDRSPVPKYISTGVWPPKAECGSTRLCSSTSNDTRRRTVATLSSACRNSQCCFSDRHQASIIEFENFTSVLATRRRSTPVASSASVSALTFSIPAFREHYGTLPEGVACWLACSSRVTLFTGANVPTGCHARMRREKLSITACRSRGGHPC